jgi:hypothetical protein
MHSADKVQMEQCLITSHCKINIYIIKNILHILNVKSKKKEKSKCAQLWKQNKTKKKETT